MQTPDRDREWILVLYKRYLEGGPDPLADEDLRRRLVAALFRSDIDPRTLRLPEPPNRGDQVQP